MSTAADRERSKIDRKYLRRACELYPADIGMHPHRSELVYLKEYVDELREQIREMQMPAKALMAKAHDQGVDTHALVSLMKLQLESQRNHINVLHQKIEKLSMGELICFKCGLRQDADGSGVSNEF